MTTYPGTTEELVLADPGTDGMKCPIAHGPENEQIGTDFFLAFSPEPKIGQQAVGLAQIPKVVGGVNPPSGRAAVSLYRRSWRGWAVSSTRAAEMSSCSRIFFAV